MPFNAELEGFAQAFSTGYGMVRSREEEEAERLRNQLTQQQVEAGQHAVEQRPILEGRAAEEYEAAKWAREHERGRIPIEEGQADTEHQLRVKESNERLAALEHQRERLLVTEPLEDKETQLRLKQLETEIGEATRQRDRLIKVIEPREDLAAAEEERQRERQRKVVEPREDLTAAEEERQRERQRTVVEPREDKAAGTVQRGLELDVEEKENKLAPVRAINKVLQQRQSGEGYTPRFPTEPETAVPEEPAAATPAPAPGPETPEEITGTHDEPVEAVSTEGPVTGTGNKPKPEDASLTTSQGTPKSRTQDSIEKVRRKEPLTWANIVDASIVATNEAHKAAKDSTGASAADGEAVSTPESDEAYVSWLGGGYGADPDTAQVVLDTVDEITEGKLNPEDKLAVAMGTGYLMYQAAGDAEAALGFAQGLAGYADQLSGQYAAFAKAAAEGGDVSASNMALMRAYMHVNNGETLKIEPDPSNPNEFIATITDQKTGRKIREEVATPEEIVAFAMGVTPGTGIDMVNRAAGKEDKTISDAAAKVLVAEYPELDLSTEEVSAMTTDEFTRIQSGAHNARIYDKPVEFTQDELKTAETDIGAAIPEIISPELSEMMKFDDPGVKEEVLPAAAQIALRSKGKSNLSPKRAARAAITLMTKGPEQVIETANGRDVLIKVKGMEPFFLDVSNYTLLSSYRSRFMETLSLPEISGSPFLTPATKGGAPTGAPTAVPEERPAPLQPRGQPNRPVPPQRSGGSIFDKFDFEPRPASPQHRGQGFGVTINPNPAPLPPGSPTLRDELLRGPR